MQENQIDEFGNFLLDHKPNFVSILHTCAGIPLSEGIALFDVVGNAYASGIKHPGYGISGQDLLVASMCLHKGDIRLLSKRMWIAFASRCAKDEMSVVFWSMILQEFANKWGEVLSCIAKDQP